MIGMAWHAMLMGCGGWDEDEDGDEMRLVWFDLRLVGWLHTYPYGYPSGRLGGSFAVCIAGG